MKPVAVTWPNIFAMIGLLVALEVALLTGTGVVMQWRIDAVQNQLADRMTVFHHEMERVERRLERLEALRS